MVRTIDPRTQVKEYKRYDRCRPCGICLLETPPAFRPLHADIYHPPTMLAGALHRQGAMTPLAQRAVLRRLRAFVDQFLKGHFEEFTATDVPGFLDTLEETNYTGAEKARLRKAYVVSERYPFGTLPERYKKGLAFGKGEYYEGVKHARGICGRTSVWKARFLRFIRAIESRVFKLRYFVKGLNDENKVKAMFRAFMADGVFFENDFESFECSFSFNFKDVCELALFRHFLGAHFPEVYAELREDAKSILMCYKWFSIRVFGKRASGDLWTSLANGFANLMLILFVAHDAGLDFSQLRVLVEGDDSVGQIAGRMPNFAAAFRELGFLAKMQERASLLETAFCHLHLTPSGLAMSDFRRVLPKFFYATSKYVTHSPRHLRMLLRSKAMSLSVEDGSTPILWALVEYAFRASEGPMDWYYLYRHMTTYEREQQVKTYRAPREPTLEARVWYDVHFKCPITMQLLLEEAIRRGDWGASCLRSMLPVLYYSGLCPSIPTG